MKKSIFIFALVITVALGSCSKDDPVSTADNNSDLSQSYYPVKTGYWWEYNSSVKGYPPIYKLTIGQQEVKNGKTYFTSTNTFSSVKSYFRVENNVFYNLGPNSQFGIEADKEYIAIDFNAAVGDSIVYTSINATTGSPQKYVILMKERGITYNASNGEIYKDVIVVRINLYAQFFSSDWTLMTYTDNYYAKGIGMVYGDLDIQGSLELKDYSFK